ncbi:MAG TPA: V-type ATP synthase subunit I [Candidatus Limnocylindria bacterium]|nr:V-type ATP synthase subunit I [Candidatus Limnocylindria bacterium]
MAIADMKRMDILLPRGDQDGALRLLQRLGCLQLTGVKPAEGAEAPAAPMPRLNDTDAALARVRWAISKLSRFDRVKQSMFRPLPALQPEEMEEADGPDVQGVIEALEGLERRAGELRGEMTGLQLRMDQLAPWHGLDVPGSMLRDTASARVFLGTAAAAGLGELQNAWEGRPASVQIVGTDRDAAHFVAVVHRSHAEEFAAALRGIGFQRADLALGEDTPAEAARLAAGRMDAAREEMRGLEGEMDALAADLPRLRAAHDGLVARRARLVAEEGSARTGSAALLSGWVPARLAPSVTETLRLKFPMAQAALRDPEEGEVPPVLLHNPALAQPFEAVVGGFALPAPGSLDPTRVLAPFFACFFGMMVSDAGYGIMMALLVPVLIRILKPSPAGKRIFRVIMLGGLFTIVWGALYNTWFGFTPWPSVFDPINNSLPVMLMCAALGALHLFAGLVLGIVQNVRQGRWLDAIYDQVSWMLLVVGIGLLALPSTSAVGTWMAIAGAGIVLLFSARNKTRNPFKRVLSGLGALYGITGWLSDLLSYMRLFGMGLATGVIGMVVNQLVGMVMSGGIIGWIVGPIIFVGVHLFNAAINILGAYVHAARLQYIEFFSKFYQEGGTAFNPLRYTPRYHRVADT